MNTHTGLAAVCAAVLLLITGCMDMLMPLPEVDRPEHEESSMIVLQLGTRERDGKTKPVPSANHSAWIPWVVNQEGELVRFKASVNVSDLDTFFYSENLNSGTYLLHGFYHVYIDYSLIDDGEIARYGPYEGYPYHVRQELPFDSPITYSLSSSSVLSLGRFFAAYELVGGLWSREEDRYRVVPDSLSYEVVSGDRAILELMKGWTHSNWNVWSQRNQIAE